MHGPVRLQVPYADTSARQLAFSLTADLQEPLAHCDHRVDAATTISLRLLGASHQVVIENGLRRLCETVACLPGTDTPLPASVRDDDYSFVSRIEECDRERLADVVDDLARRSDAHRAAGLPAVIGHFPGEPLAVTAVLAVIRADAIAWETWHTYPQCAEVVVTASELRRPDPVAPR
ncbi:hypothetical protein D7316_02768 [Gordonia insulae]|uniref:DUF2617 family protein n=1 Tax=Gordonia insulae TaxID=2420509 RepID=A0A3G8JM67_9ACTN|nr:hypothetical protein D7316_02768 [Gordonia insulae]